MEAISALSDDVPFDVRVGAQLPFGSPVSSAPVQGHIPAVVQSVIDKFMAVFKAEIQAGLPPPRPTDHMIDFGTGCNPTMPLRVSKLPRGIGGVAKTVGCIFGPWLD